MTHRAQTIPVPQPSPLVFTDGITHPDLWLWDAWTYAEGPILTLFTLAIARRDAAGRATTPGMRNDYPFHIRKFVSTNKGASWSDKGAYLMPDERPGSATAHNVWSGSACLYGGELVFGFTGLPAAGSGRSFVQTICVATASQGEAAPLTYAGAPVSDPLRDYDAIRAAGYYLGPRETLGADSGEEGGPILAWRDPFIIPEADDTFRAFWAAKVAPDVPAVAHARIRKVDGAFILDRLFSPILLPDAAEYTQAEVPKVYADPAGGRYFLLISTCNRRREDQPDDEVSKELRLFKAARPEGPWIPYRGDQGSVVPGVDHLFGGSLEYLDFDQDTATLIAPYTEMSAPARQLTFAAPRPISLGDTSAHLSTQTSRTRR